MLKGLKGLFGGKEKEKKQILSPVEGKAVPMSEVNDPTFSQEILGKGAAVIPAKGRVVAPAEGEVTMLFDTLHALSIQTTAGAELIIHIGLDTVNLKGEHFKAHVKAGDHVKPGDLLVEFDMARIKAAGYDVITPVIICNTPDFPDMTFHTGDVKELDALIDLD